LFFYKSGESIKTRHLMEVGVKRTLVRMKKKESLECHPSRTATNVCGRKKRGG